jgi:DNA primase
MGSKREEISAKLEIIIEELFEKLDIPITFTNNTYISCETVCHSGNNKTALTYYKNTGLWICWSNGCNKEHGSDLLGLIMAIKSCDFKSALEFAKHLLEGKEISNELINDRKAMKVIKSVDYWKQHRAQNVINESVLTRLTSPLVYCKKRGLDYNLAKQIGCGYAKSGPLSGRFVLPIRNIDSKLVGFSGRKTNDNSEGPKWLHWPRGISKTVNLFNIDRAVKHVEKEFKIIICEGPFDVLKLDMAGIKNAVAIFGTTLSDGQIEILAKCNIVTVILALDPDEAGQKAIKKNVEKLHRSLFSVNVLKIDGELDIGAMDIEDINKMFERESI